VRIADAPSSRRRAYDLVRRAAAGGKGRETTFRVLGPIEVVDAGVPIELRPGRQASLLAYLLLHANEVVPRDALIDAPWGEQPPASATNALQVQVTSCASGSGMRSTRLTSSSDSPLIFPSPTGGYLDLHNFRSRYWIPAQRTADIQPPRRIYDLPRP
jgi:hypothetical protein